MFSFVEAWYCSYTVKCYAQTWWLIHMAHGLNIEALTTKRLLVWSKIFCCPFPFFRWVRFSFSRLFVFWREGWLKDLGKWVWHHATEPSPKGSWVGGWDGPRGRSQLEAPERANQWAHHVQLGMSANHIYCIYPHHSTRNIKESSIW